ncbi:zinc finger MYM-type protein 1-like [Pollicipes pollicipes]|uniref:zinc finger MYM-type protein 1-like n=1 Tax=Pollicipes pollicipes TaxID=41117 RepID=UPI0018854B92|nr:zinc finger MYM-type protein 1-like [Pollicipes pollicipes]
MAQHDPVPKRWLARRKESRMHFTSPEALAEVQRQLAHAVIRRVVDEVGVAESFAVVVDETADVAGREHMVICLRFVTEALTVRETSIGLYQADSTTAAALFGLIQDALTRLQLPMDRIRGQCYDGAANMAGAFRGVQARVKAVEPRAVFVHCTAHRLNLVCQEALNGVREVRDAIQEVGRLASFYRDSPKRMVALEHAGAQMSLRPLCPTRWTCSEACLTSVVKQYGPLVTSLDKLADDAKVRPEVSATASGFGKTLRDFEFFFGLRVALLLLQVTTPAMRTMQGQSQSVSANLGVARAVRDVVLSQRDRFERLWAELTSDAERLGVGCPRLRRPFRPPRRLDGGSEPHQHACPKGRYRQVYCEAVDWLAGSISGRFDSDEPTLATAEKALLTAKEDALVATATFYNLDLERLRLHCQMLVDVASSQRKAPLTSLDDVVALLSDEGLRQVLPAATSLLRLVLTAPATSCAAERAFSLLRRLRDGCALP